MKLTFDFQGFLNTHWRQQPAHVAGAISPFTNPLSPDELAGLAVEEMIGSQLIISDGHEVEMRSGPIDFDSLPASAALSLTVNAADHWHGELTPLRALFNAFPQWLFTHLHANYEMAGIHHQPNSSDHDLLIVQGSGEREWQIAPHNWQENNAEPQRFTLHSGDILYIPAGFYSKPNTDSESMSYILTIRSPAASEMFSHLGSHLLHSEDADAATPLHQITLQDQPAAISADDFAKFEDHLRHTLEQTDLLKTWMGEYLSQPAYELDVMSAEPPWQLSEVRDFLDKGGVLCKVAGLKTLYHTDRPEQVFVNGESFTLPSDVDTLSQVVCNQSTLTATQLGALIDHPAVLAFLTEMANLGYWYPNE
ncbi:winged helix domain-containing protein [Thaumasiovibrio subtropicus]|uniref:ribosomal protein uL16 3-hydroxylase n=1 Tax=Thaumasiovibrio subtropicus TaxID=1891207 RepID=UPI00131B2E1A|nr:winged helix domain-containing protein [Thaumasiovibrio subtropicus]